MSKDIGLLVKIKAYKWSILRKNILYIIHILINPIIYIYLKIFNLNYIIDYISLNYIK